MSVIVAIKENGCIYLGADSQMTCGSSKVTLSNPNNYKLWNVENTDTAIMGGVGSARDICAIRACDYLISPSDYVNDAIDYNLLVDDVEPLIRDILIKHYYVDEDNPYENLDSRYIFAIDDKMYTIEKGAVYEHEGYVVIGSGTCESVGCLYSITNKLTPEERIVKAIKASCSNDLYIDYPIILTNTKTREYDVITKENEAEYLKTIRQRYLHSKINDRSAKKEIDSSDDEDELS